MSLQERLLFWSNFRRRFHDTGAITPSSRGLALAMVEGIQDAQEPRRILEVGPGTGPFTRQIIRLLKPGDELHLCEINSDLLNFLRQQIERAPEFSEQKEQIVYHPCPVQELDEDLDFQHIVSGLPFNNFPPELVEDILNSYRQRLAAGGTLRFFEYLAIRVLKAPFVTRNERDRLKNIADILNDLCDKHATKKTIVWLNLPPAIAWRLSFDNSIP